MVNGVGEEPGHKIWVASIIGAFRESLTITIAVVVEEQPVISATVFMLNVTVLTPTVVFVNVPDIVPFPFVGIVVVKPGAEAVQFHVIVPEGDPDIPIGTIGPLLQTVSCANGAMVTVGFTFTTTF